MMESTQKWLVNFRRELHRFPEISGEEKETAKRIVKALQPFAPTQIITGLGGHGVAAIFGEDKSKTILVRCELDALPIKELGDVAHKSTIEGKSHMCGHDGHMSILIGLAKKLSDNLPKKGRAILLFQPAEENGAGAKAVLEDPKFEAIKPDMAVSLHNLPGVEKYQIVCKTGSFTASVRSMIIKLHGKTAHAGEPDKGQNPALAIAQIVEGALALQRPMQHDDFMQVTPIQIEMGEEAFGISAGYGEVKFTIRTWQNQHMDALVKDLVALVENTASAHQLKHEIAWTQFFAANQNDDEVVKIIARAAQKLNLNYRVADAPNRWGEDFGLFTTQFKGAMFGLGSGVNLPALHNPDYDFPDEIAPTGIDMFFTIIQDFLD